MELTELLEEECEKMNDKIDHRAQNMFSLMLFCAKKILQSVDRMQYFDDVWQAAISLVIPSYVSTTSSVPVTSAAAISAADMNVIIEGYLKDTLMKTVMGAEKEEVSVLSPESSKSVHSESAFSNEDDDVTFVQEKKGKTNKQSPLANLEESDYQIILDPMDGLTMI
ncbi:hypothetical protein ACROYT_G014920 [Oculina patagonica]